MQLQLPPHFLYEVAFIWFLHAINNKDQKYKIISVEFYIPITVQQKKSFLLFIWNVIQKNQFSAFNSIFYIKSKKKL